MTWGRVVAGGALLAGLVSGPGWASPLFPDVAGDHWARDAVAALAAKGVIEGYPDGAFRGDRAPSRWELAALVARALDRIEQAQLPLATRAELEELRAVARALGSELEAMGVRIAASEQSVGRLDQRVGDLERVRFYGRVHTVGVSNNLHGESAGIGTLGNPGIDWSTGRLLLEGSGFTSLAILGLNAEISQEVVAGAEFAAFTTQGDGGVDQYWGVSAPWLANPWTARNSGQPGVQPDNNAPYTRMVLDNFWIRHKPSDTRLTVGSYFSRYLGGFVFNGARNPNINLPQWLPFYGADVHGPIGGKGSPFRYEAFYSLNPDASLYRTHSMGGVLRYESEDERALFSVQGVQHRNERIHDGVTVGLGGPLIPIPAVSFTGPGAPPVPLGSWLGTPQGAPGPAPSAFVGPQSQFTFGLEGSYLLDPGLDLRLSGEFATSSYNPDTSGLAFQTTAQGSLFRIGLGASPAKGLDLKLDYFSVAPTYDPFVVAYPTPPAIPVFLPYGNYYSAYYQLHDYLEYPNNRQGFRFQGSYTFEGSRTRLYAVYGDLEQVAPTTPAQILTVGNVEPLFPLLQAGGRQRGSVENVGAGISHLFDNGLKAELAWYRYGLNRPAPAVDDVALLQNSFRLDLSYPLDEDLKLRGSYWQMDLSGHTGLLNTDFGQRIPGIGLDWALTEQASVSVDYRLFDLDQRAAAGGDYSGSQLMVEMKLDF